MPSWRGRSSGSGRSAAILLPSLFPGDATSNDAIGMQAALRARGVDARLFAEQWAPEIDAGGIDEAREVLRRERPLVVYHQSTGWERGVDLLASARGRIIVRDHNVTPASYFERVSDDFVTASRLGAEHRRTLARDARVELFLAASELNAGELRGLGAPSGRVAVLPPFHRCAELEKIAPEEASLRRWSNRPASLLFVGRIAPNKGHRRILRIAAMYRELFGEALTVRFVGRADPRLGGWLRVLEKDAARLGLDGTIDFVGHATEAELKAAYLTSRIFLCCSEHEGFCVPLIEAAWIGLPVVSTYEEGTAATLGDKSVVVRAESDEVAAALVRKLLEDASWRDEVSAAQRAFVQSSYATSRIESDFTRALGSLDAIPMSA